MLCEYINYVLNDYLFVTPFVWRRWYVTMGEKKKIMVVEVQTIMRYGLCSALENEAGFIISGETGSGRAAVEMALRLCPDVVVMDVDLPELNGIEVTRQIIAGNPDVRIIALSMLRKEQCVMGMLDAGARGFLLKKCHFTDLVDAIKAVCMGKKYLSADIAGMVVDRALNPSRELQNHGSKVILTPREREVLQLVAEGKTSLGMSKILGISKRTVDIHRKNIMDKLDLRSVAELTRYAIAEGLVFV